MIRALIVDDEGRGRKTLERLLERFCPDVEIIGSVESVDAALVAIETERPDLLFLDIEMPFESGFDLLDLLSEARPEVVFTTAHDQYALRAAKASALDYLLKPIASDELVAAVAKARKRLRPGGPADPDAAVLKRNLADAGADINRLAIPTDEGLTFVRVDDIIRCTAESCYTRLHMLDGTEILVSRTLKEFEKMLPEILFVRVHHSHLINLQHAKKYLRSDGGTIVMCDNSSVLVSRRKKDELMRRLVHL
jgi:two-component system LytT family response regulator